MSIDNFFHDKVFELKNVQIISSSGNNVDIYPSMVELNIYEDVFSTTMHGEIAVNDTNDLITSMPLLGFEYLKVVFTKPGSNPIEKIFRIFKVDALEMNLSNQANQSYVIKFCSEEEIVSSGSIVSKSYKGKNVKQIVEDVIKSYLGASHKINAESMHNTPGLYDLIIPNLKPFEAINWVVTRTTPPFLFYENMKGFNLKNVQKLFEQAPVVKYTYAPKNAILVGPEGINKEIPETQDIKIDMYDVINFEFYSAFDIIDALNNGMFSSSLQTIDVVRRKNRTYTNEYQDNFDNSKHVDSNGKFGSFQNNMKDRTKKTINEKYAALRRLVPTNMEHDTDQIIKAKQPNIKPNRVEDWMLQRISQLEQLNYFRLKLIAPGNPAIKAGDVIEFSMPRITPKDDSKESKEHPYYTGNYLVTAIRHKINPMAYEIVMEGVKDCVNAKYDSALENDPLVENAKKS